MIFCITNMPAYRDGSTGILTAVFRQFIYLNYFAYCNTAVLHYANSWLFCNTIREGNYSKCGCGNNWHVSHCKMQNRLRVLFYIFTINSQCFCQIHSGNYVVKARFKHSIIHTYAGQMYTISTIFAVMIDILIQWCSWNICGSNIFLFRAILISNLVQFMVRELIISHDDVIKWNHFPRNWPFVRGIHRSRWIPHTKASDAELSWMLSLICIWIKGCVYNPEAGDFRRHRGHYDVNVMVGVVLSISWNCSWRNRNGNFIGKMKKSREIQNWISNFILLHWCVCQC